MATLVGTIPKPVRFVEGVLKVGDTRVSLDTVVYHFNNGLDAAEIQDQYDSMSLAQVHAAIAYYLHNKAEVDEYLADQEIRQEETRKRIERDFPPRVTREVLLARKNGEDPCATPHQRRQINARSFRDQTATTDWTSNRRNCPSRRMQPRRRMEQHYPILPF